MEPTLEPAPHDQELRLQRDFLRRLARGLLGDEAAAEDVVQEAELRALERGPRDTASLGAWLATVTRRLALNLRRERERRSLRERAVARPEAQPGPDEALEGLDLQRAVLESVRALDEPYRTALWQRYYEDKSPAEIAARLGVPLATAKTRLRRALEQLRAALDARHGGRRDAWALGLVGLVGHAGPGALVGTAGVTLGGMLVMKKLVLACALVVLALLGWRAWKGAPAPAADASAPLARAELLEAPPIPPPPAPLSANERVAANPSGAAPVPESVPEGATLEVHVTWAEDGTDAAGIGLVLWPADDCRAELRAQSVETDEHGRARLAGIAAGSYELHGDRGSQTPLELAAGEERELELALPAGLDVVGHVLDGAGQPVGGADVWLEGRSGTGSLGGRVVTRAAADGSFRLRALGEDQLLGAFAPGCAPAFLKLLRHLAPAPGEHTVPVTLVLDRPGRTFVGRVLDPEGRPVPGARVALGTRGNRVRGDAWQSRARMLATDELGRFTASWIASEAGDGHTEPVHVLAPELALARAETPALGEDLVVRLETGVTIEGVVRSADGTPFPGARVAVVRAGALEVQSSPFALPSANAGSDGAYRLEHVSSGEIELLAGHDGLATHSSGGAREARTCADGEHVRWDLALVIAQTIRGRVVDLEGHALAGKHVLASGVSGMRVLTSDPQGAFEFTPDDPDTEWTFALTGETGVLDQRERVRVGTEIELVARVHAGSIRGGFTDRAGLAQAGERIIASLSADAGIQMANTAYLDAQGAFAYDGVPPGRYRVAIQAGEDAIAHSPWFELAEGEAVELDWLESQPRTALLVACTLPPGVALESVRGWLSDPLGEQGVGLEPLEGGLGAVELEPGSHRLRLSGPGLATHQQDVVLVPGEDLRLAVELRAGFERRLSFAPPAELSVARLTVTLTEEASGRAQVHELRNAFPGHPLTLRVGLAPGRYTCEARTREGVGASGTFEVTAESPAELAFELR